MRDVFNNKHRRLGMAMERKKMITIGTIITVIIFSMLVLSIADVFSRVSRGLPVTYEDIASQLVLIGIVMFLIYMIR